MPRRNWNGARIFLSNISTQPLQVKLITLFTLAKGERKDLGSHSEIWRRKQMLKTTQREKAVENYNWFPAVHSFGVEKFEFSVPAKFVIMTWSVYKNFLSSNLKFQNKELSKLTLAGPQQKLTPHSLLRNKNKTTENSNVSTSKLWTAQR